MPVFLRPREAYKSQQDGDQNFSPLQLCVGRSWHYAAHEAWMAMSLTPPKHYAVNGPGFFCWERDATSTVVPCSLCHPLFGLLGLLSIASHGWLCPARSPLCCLTPLPGTFQGLCLMEFFLYSFFLKVKNYIQPIMSKEHKCCRVQDLKGSQCS